MSEQVPQGAPEKIEQSAEQTPHVETVTPKPDTVVLINPQEVELDSTVSTYHQKIMAMAAKMIPKCRQFHNEGALSNTNYDNPMEIAQNLVWDLPLVEDPQPLVNYATKFAAQQDNAMYLISACNTALSTTENKRLYVNLLSKACSQKQLVTFVEDLSILEELLTRPSQTKLKRMFNTVRVTKFHSIPQYNMITESAHGWSKLIALLQEAYTDYDNLRKLEYYWKQFQLCCGEYSLDLSRALDVFLDIAVIYLDGSYDFTVAFLKESDYWPKSDNGNELAAKFLADKTVKDGNKNALLLTSILIKAKFLNFQVALSFFPALGDVVGQYEKELEEQASAVVENALAMAAPLPEEDENGKSIKSTEAETVVENVQIETKETYRMMLFKACISNGDYGSVLEFMRQIPRIQFVDPEVLPLMTRMCNAMLEPLYRETVGLKIDQSWKTRGAISTLREKVGIVETSLIPMTKETTMDALDGKKYFYTEWADSLPKVTSLQEFNEFIFLWFPFFDCHLSEDLISKFSVIARHNMDDDETTVDEWARLFRKLVYPSCVSVKFTSTVMHVYQMMVRFPVNTRYQLYGDMIGRLQRENKFVEFAYNKAKKDTKNALKSLSFDNQDDVTRQIARLASANPLAVFEVTLAQVENYDKISELVVECATHFTPYTFDCLGYSILLRLFENRNVFQSDGMNENMWIVRLSQFISAMAKKHSKFDISTLIMFIVKKLHRGEIIGMILLNSLVTELGGIQQLSDLSKSQLTMLATDDSLSKICRKLIFDKRDECVIPAGRLLKNLSSEISDIVACLSNIEQNVILSKNDHIKIIGHKKDTLASCLHSFIEFVNFFSKDEIDFASFEKLLEKGVSIPWAFELWRKSLGKEEYTKKANLQSVIDEFGEFFVTFWKLSLREIYYDANSYEDESKKLLKLNATLETKMKADISRSEKMKVANVIKANTSLLEQLPVDSDIHLQLFTATKEFLDEKKIAWFTELDDSFIQNMFETCLLPRVVHSSTDAIFCGKFIFEVFTLKESMKILGFYFSSGILSTFLMSCTLLEAESFGFFHIEVFSKLEELNLNPEQRKMVFEWHSMVLNSLCNALQAESYMSVRNSINFLKNLVSVYPVVDVHCEKLQQQMENNFNHETRSDIKLASGALIGHIKSRIPHWIKQADYITMDEDELKSYNQEMEKKRVIDEYYDGLRKEKEREEAERRAEQRRKDEEAAEQIRKEREEKQRLEREEKERERKEKEEAERKEREERKRKEREEKEQREKEQRERNNQKASERDAPKRASSESSSQDSKRTKVQTPVIKSIDELYGSMKMVISALRENKIEPVILGTGDQILIQAYEEAVCAPMTFSNLLQSALVSYFSRALKAANLQKDEEYIHLIGELQGCVQKARPPFRKAGSKPSVPASLPPVPSGPKTHGAAPSGPKTHGAAPSGPKTQGSAPSGPKGLPSAPSGPRGNNSSDRSNNQAGNNRGRNRQPLPPQNEISKASSSRYGQSSNPSVSSLPAKPGNSARGGRAREPLPPQESTSRKRYMGREDDRKRSRR